jgi:hypothetical protein
MVRLLAAALFFTCCLTAQLRSQSPPETASGAPVLVSPDSSAQFPLEAFPEFTAVMVGSVIPGDEREIHIYRSGNLLRTPGPEEHAFFITNLTTLETFGVSAGGCIHDPNPYFRSAPFSSIRPSYKVERVPAGQETVGGHPTKIEDVTLSSPKLTRPLTLRFWEAEDLKGFPVKVEFRRLNGHNPVIEYKDVVFGPQDPTLFIYPKSCDASPGLTSKKGKALAKAKKPAAATPAVNSPK